MPTQISLFASELRCLRKLSPEWEQCPPSKPAKPVRLLAEKRWPSLWPHAMLGKLNYCRSNCKCLPLSQSRPLKKPSAAQHYAAEHRMQVFSSNSSQVRILIMTNRVWLSVQQQCSKTYQNKISKQTYDALRYKNPFWTIYILAIFTSRFACINTDSVLCILSQGCCLD